MYPGPKTYPGTATFPGDPVHNAGIFRSPIYQRRVPIIPPLTALINYSKAVLRIQGQWIETEFPTEEQIASADYYFPGGYEVEVNADAATALTLAGYTVSLE